MFRDIFQPSGSGALSSWLGRGLFWAARGFRPLLAVAGPLTVVFVISVWAGLIACGFALLYWPRFPAAFEVAGPQPQSTFDRIYAVLYFSLSALTTLGAPNLTPKGGWVRIVAS